MRSSLKRNCILSIWQKRVCSSSSSPMVFLIEFAVVRFITTSRFAIVAFSIFGLSLSCASTKSTQVPKVPAAPRGAQSADGKEGKPGKDGQLESGKPKTAEVDADSDPLGDEPSPDSISEVEKLGALPLPAAANVFDMKKFLEKYRPLYQVHQNLWKEWRALRKVFSQREEVTPREQQQIEESLQENPEKSHWLYCTGFAEMLNQLKNKEGTKLQHDREKEFIKDMKALVFLGQKNDAMFGGKRYSEFNRTAYKELGFRYFGRKTK